MRLLVTRPDPDGARTAAALRERGHDVLVAPLLSIVAVADPAIGDGPWAAVAITSAHAIDAVASRPPLAAVPVFTVGGKTAKAARAAGLPDVRSADGDVHALAATIATALPGATDPVLYLAGEERAGDLEGLLAGHGLSVKTVVVYRAVAQTRLPDAVRAALAAREIDAVLHYSRRTAEAFLAACTVDGLDDIARTIRHLCLSPQVAAVLRDTGAQDVRVAAHPDEANLSALL